MKTFRIWLFVAPIILLSADISSSQPAHINFKGLSINGTPSFTRFLRAGVYSSYNSFPYAGTELTYNGQQLVDTSLFTGVAQFSSGNVGYSVTPSHIQLGVSADQYFQYNAQLNTSYDRFVAGRILKSNGQPYFGVLVRISAVGNPSYFSENFFTDADGRFVIIGLQPGSYELKAYEPRNIKLMATSSLILGQYPIEGVELRIPRQSGTVIVSGSSTGFDSLVRLYSDSPSSEVLHTTYKAPDGSFWFENVIPGNYRIQAGGNGPTTTITVGSAGLSGLALQGSQPNINYASSYGQITTPSGAPIAGVMLRSQCLFQNSSYFPQIVTTNSEGTYFVSGKPPTGANCKLQPFDESVGLNFDVPEVNFTFNNSTAQNFDFIAVPTSYKVSGKVKTCLKRQHTVRIRSLSSDPNSQTVVEYAQKILLDGPFSFRLIPGTYKIEVYDSANLLQTSKNITVSSSNISNVSLTGPACQSTKALAE